MELRICTLFSLLAATAIFATCQKTSAPTQSNLVTEPAVYYAWDKFVMGADLSYVNQVQDYGGVYKDSGLVKDPYTIFKNSGANVIRVRIWHNPLWTAPLNGGKLYNDIKDVEKTIQRAKNAGMAVNLDLHYSDTWADPGNQQTPAAWVGLPLAILKDSVYNYTLAVLNYLKSKNLVPEMIQVGNENNNGMLWPVGKIVGADYSAFCTLLKAGIKAVRDFSITSPIKPQIILHVAQLQDAGPWLAKVINVNGVNDFDIIGLSHYFKWSTINNMADIKNTIINFKATWNKKVMIVETAYPFTDKSADSYNNVIAGDVGVSGYPVSPQGQYQYMKDLTQAVIDAGGTGIMYWEPAWITSGLRDLWGQGSSWENMALFDFSGNAQPGMRFMVWPYRF
jgi:arabinogalactan endo-1,4-beta-galactosidase